MTVRLDIAYHGAEFAGWAVQPGLRTVQGELEEALKRVMGEPVGLSVAGRTDAGVHAWGQVASFQSGAAPPSDGLARALNALTGTDLTVKEASDAPESFDARRAAVSRTYCYRVLAASRQNPFERGVSLFWPHSIDPHALESCADALLGSHDFTAFTPAQTEHLRFERRILAASWREAQAPLGEGRVLEFWVEANAFMRSMVRVLVGTMLEVAGGRRPAEDFQRLLGGAQRGEAGDTAKAHGLHLVTVRY